MTFDTATAQFEPMQLHEADAECRCGEDQPMHSINPANAPSTPSAHARQR